MLQSRNMPSFSIFVLGVLVLLGCDDGGSSGSGGTGMSPAGTGGTGNEVIGAGGTGGDGNQVVNPGEGGSGGAGNSVVDPGEGGSGGGGNVVVPPPAGELDNVNASILIHARRFGNLSSVFHQNSGLRAGRFNLTIGKLYMMVCTEETGNGEDCFRNGEPYFIADLPLPGVREFPSGEDMIRADNIQLPVGEHDVYFVVDSQESQEKDSAFFLEDGTEQDGGARNFDVVATGLFEGGSRDLQMIEDGHPNSGENYYPNPPGPGEALTPIQITVEENQLLTIGTESGVNPDGSANGQPLMFGHIVFDPVTPKPAPGPGKFLVASKQPDNPGNQITIIDESTHEIDVASPLVAELSGQPYPGEICGMIHGADNSIYVLGSQKNDNDRRRIGHIFTLNSEDMLFENTVVTLPDGGNQANADFNLCKGAYFEQDDRQYLALISDGYLLSNSTGHEYGLVLVDITNPAAPRVKEYKRDAFFVTPSAGGAQQNLEWRIKSVEYFNGRLYAVTAAWAVGERNPPLKVYVLDVHDDTPDAGGEISVTLLQEVEAGNMSNCSGPISPGLFIHTFDGSPYLLLGSSVPAEFQNIGGQASGIRAYPINGDGTLDEAGLQTKDTEIYGRSINQLAPSPNGQELFVVNACETTGQLNFILDYGVQNNVTKQTMAVLDLTAPLFTFKYEDRDLDGYAENNRGPNGEDGDEPLMRHDGGVDMTSLSVFKYTRSWCSGCNLSPVQVNDPIIAVGGQILFLLVKPTEELGRSSVRGAADILPINRSTGEVLVLREDFDPFTTGSVGIWGYDLSPNIPNADDQSLFTTATSVIYVP